MRLGSTSAPFEIRIAILGNVSAGKTTFLNALLRDKFGEVSMKRTTAGVNFFHLQAPHTDESKDVRDADSILKEIKEDNVKLRQGETVQEKHFDILMESFLEMRKDTKLVIVDLPGINEAKTNLYREYVDQHWDMFDAVVCVMDSKQGVNTADQVNLLSLVKENLQKKDVPIIILCNKVDDPDDEEQAELVKEARLEIEKMFEVGCRTAALKTLTKYAERKETVHRNLSPAFIPFSAIHAYIHQSASRMTKETFATAFDKDLIEKLGREQLGRHKWKKLTPEQKIEQAYRLITEEPDDVIEDSNFDKVMAALQYFCGGPETQRALIEKQLTKLAKGPFTAGFISLAIRNVFEKCQYLKKEDGGTGELILSPDRLKKAFWQAYQKFERKGFRKFQKQFPAGFGELAGPMEELIAYQQLTSLEGWEDDAVLARMKSYMQKFVGFLMDEYAKVRFHCQTSLDAFEWTAIWEALLLLSANPTFCMYMGREKMVFNRFLQEARSMCSPVKDETCGCEGTSRKLLNSSCIYCESCEIFYCRDANPQFIPRPLSLTCPACRSQAAFQGNMCMICRSNTIPIHNWNLSSQTPTYNDQGELEYASNLKVKLPIHLSDPEHPAHVLWLFCGVLEKLPQDHQGWSMVNVEESEEEEIEFVTQSEFVEMALVGDNEGDY